MTRRMIIIFLGKMILIILIKIRRIYQIVFAGTDEIGNTDDNQEKMMIIFPRKDNIDILIIITRK